jgi:hypothetical protein
MKRILLAVLALAAMPALAFAQAISPTQIQAPIGDWISAALPYVAWVIALLWAWALRFLPASVVSILKTAQVEQLLKHAIGYGLNAVAGATKGQILTADVGNEVIAKAVAYAVEHGPSAIISWLGGEKGLRDRIIARLDLHPDVEVIPDVYRLTQAPPPVQVGP